ncbi:MAG: hypothetical protein ACTSYB_08310 [Candidatus Helarchaeota archaeon]
MSLRPGGVTGIAVLFLLGGGILLVLGILCAFVTAWTMAFYFANIDGILAGLPLIGDLYVNNLQSFLMDPNIWLIAGIIFIAIGVIDVLTFIGLLKLKKWGYYIALIISIPLIIVILGIIFIWYLRKDEVKAAFDIM